MTDVLFYATPDGGEIVMENGQFVLSDGKYAAVYLSLFGGNDDDSGLDGDALAQWWGSMDETESSRRYRSETQYALKSAPLLSARLQGYQDAAERDLDWLTEDIADEVAVFASMPAIDRISLDVDIVIDGERVPFDFDHIRTEES